jgi:hypothetical protein
MENEMNKKGIILCTALLLSSSMVFAEDNDKAVPSEEVSATPTNEATPANVKGNESKDADAIPKGDATSKDVDATSKDVDATSNNSGTDSSKDSITSGQESQTSTTNNNNETTNINNTNVNNTNVNVDASITEVNNKAVIQGITTAPSFTSVEFRNDVYYLPETISPIRGFYFLNISSTERVCSLKKITKVKVISTPTITKVMIGKKKRVLYCYDRSYFSF